MASINMSIRTDSQLKENVEQVLSQLSMTMSGTINMFLQQIVRDQVVPLSLSLNTEQSLCADFLRAKVDREQGVEYLSADDVPAKIGKAIERVFSVPKSFIHGSVHSWRATPSLSLGSAHLRPIA